MLIQLSLQGSECYLRELHKTTLLEHHEIFEFFKTFYKTVIFFELTYISLAYCLGYLDESKNCVRPSKE